MPIESLAAVQFTDINQFVEDINNRFAIIQNSPLFKGVAGKSVQGDKGDSGLRGSVMSFVNFAKFTEQFPNELSSSSKIDLTFINSKLTTFDGSTKLLAALGVTEFVNKDVIVLTNSAMLSYNVADNLFVDSGVAFNENVNLASSIENKIEDYVSVYFEDNPQFATENSIVAYSTYAKSYADSNSSYISPSTPTASSVYVPHIEGVTNTNNGALVTDHKYFGYTDDMFPESKRRTTVLGSVKRFITLLQSTISTDTTETLSSDYAISSGNLPSLVVMQETDKGGILIGRKNATNLRSFAAIFKNSDGELCIKSDSGELDTDYSMLKLGKTRMWFGKRASFADNVTVYGKFTLYGDAQYDSKQIKTGGNIVNDLGLTIGDKDIELGYYNPSTFEHGKTIFPNSEIHYKIFKGKVLITDADGKLSQKYSIETAEPPTSLGSDNPIFSPNKILTSAYYKSLFNLMKTVSGDFSAYYTRDQFYTMAIEKIWCRDEVRSSGLLHNEVFHSDRDAKTIRLGAKLTPIPGGSAYLSDPDVRTYIASSSLYLESFSGNVLVTSGAGKVSNSYSLTSRLFTAAEKTVPQSTTDSLALIDNAGLSSTKFITESQHKDVIDTLNNIKSRLKITPNANDGAELFYSQNKYFSELDTDTKKDIAYNNLGFGTVNKVTLKANGLMSDDYRTKVVGYRWKTGESPTFTNNELPENTYYSDSAAIFESVSSDWNIVECGIVKYGNMVQLKICMQCNDDHPTLSQLFKLDSKFRPKMETPVVLYQKTDTETNKLFSEDGMVSGDKMLRTSIKTDGSLNSNTLTEFDGLNEAEGGTRLYIFVSYIGNSDLR